MISVNKIIYILICLFLIVNYFLTTEFTFIISFIAVLVSFWGRGFTGYHREIITIPALFILLGLINCLGNKSELIFKDFYYFLNPIIVFSFGYISAYYISITKFFRIIILLGVFLGLVYILNHNWSGITSVNAFHQEEGVASYIVIIALVILILKIFKKEYFFPKHVSWIFIAILSITCIIAVSRTFLLIFIILIITGSGQLKFEKYFVMKFIFFILSISIATFFIINFQSADRSSFVGKLLYSANEVSISNYNNLSEINNNWRGFEAYKGLEQINRGTLLELFIGQGFGTSTPLGIEIKLGDEYFTEIPYFHNGYITLLIKTGIIGLFLYLIFIIKMCIVNLKDKLNFDEDYDFCRNIIPGLAMVLLLTTYIISGWLNKITLAPVIFSLGYFISAKVNIKNFYNAMANAKD